MHTIGSRSVGAQPCSIPQRPESILPSSGIPNHTEVGHGVSKPEPNHHALQSLHTSTMGCFNNYSSDKTKLTKNPNSQYTNKIYFILKIKIDLSSETIPAYAGIAPLAFPVSSHCRDTHSSYRFLQYFCFSTPILVLKPQGQSSNIFKIIYKQSSEEA